ncbi:hypothetical protein Tco_0772018 [Tanacetum coccineum]|uniref:Reverse transcriptase domain-containing protein n=1 Tax=Tanacetum coccineum TaxID=301880 RepID=A0ABQ4ZKC1_9ASTR
MPREGLAIIESKSKVRYSRSRPNDSRAITNAPSSTSSPSNNSFKIQQMAALFEDKMNIRMSRLEKAISEKNATTPAIVKAVEEVCVTCGSNHNFNNCPLTRNDFPVFHDNIHQFQQTAAVGNFVQRNPPNLANQMRPPGTLPSQTVTNPRQQINVITTRSGKSLEGPSTPLVPTPVVSIPSKEPEQNPETSTEKVQNPNLENTAHVPPTEEEDSIFMEIPKPKAKKTVNVEIQDLNSPRPNLYLSKLPYPERMKVRENDKRSAQHSRFLKMFKQLCLEIGLKDALQMPKVQPNDDPFSGSTTTHSDDPSPSSSPVKTSDNLEEFADELALLKKKDVEIKNSNISDEPVLLNTPLSDKVECFAPEDNNDEIDAFLAMEVSSNFEEGYFDSEGDVTFLDNLLSDNATHNLVFEGISDHEPEQNESSITFSPRSDPLHHEFAGELLTLPSRNDRNFMLIQVQYISLLPISPIPNEDSEPAQEEIDIFLVPDDLIPPGVENDDFENKDNELPNLDHQDNPSIPRPPPHQMFA